MIDINSELNDFKNARYGKDVRSAFVSAFEKFMVYSLCGSGQIINNDNKEEICGGNLDNLSINTIYAVASKIEMINKPTERPAIIISFGRSSSKTNGSTQVIIDDEYTVYVRQWWGKWNDWKNLTDLDEEIEMKVVKKVYDIKDYIEQFMYEMRFPGKERAVTFHKGFYHTYDKDVLQSNAYGSNYIKVEEGGVLVYRNPKYRDLSWPHKCFFYHLIGNAMVPAEDYEFAYVGADDESGWTSHTLYYPYADNLYMAIAYVSDGRIIDDFYCIKNQNATYSENSFTNLSPVNVYYSPSLGRYHHSFRASIAASYKPYSRAMGTYIRNKDVAYVAASPKYSLLAWYYDKDGNLIDYDRAPTFGIADTPGVGIIDLRERPKDGYTFVAIFNTSIKGEDGVINLGMPMCSAYEDVKNNVLLQYNNGVRVSCMENKNPIIASNLNKIMMLPLGDVKEFVYTPYFDESELPVASMKDATGVFYNGEMYTNTALMDVPYRSVLSMIKNPNGRIWFPKWTEDTMGIRGVGMVCNSPCSFAYGWREQYRVSYLSVFEENEKLKKVSDNFNYLEDYDSLQYGDWLSMYEEHNRDGHMFIVTDLYKINGEPIAIEVTEAYPPFVRKRYLYIDPLFVEKNKEYSYKEFPEKFIHQSRAKKGMLRRADDVFNLASNVKDNYKIMLDRGDYSVYAEGNKHVYLSVLVPAVGNISLRQDNSVYRNINLNTLEFIYQRDDSVKVYDIKEYLNNGYTEILVDGEVEVHVLVAPSYQVSQDNAVISTNIPNDKIVYSVSNYMEPDGGQGRYQITHLGSEWQDGGITLPKNLDNGYVYDWTEIVIDTDYGTYICRMDYTGSSFSSDADYLF